MIEAPLYESLQRQATNGGTLTVSPEDVKAIAEEVAAGRVAQAREQQLVAALKLVEFGLISMESTAPACPACRSARGMGHMRGCPVGSALTSGQAHI